MDYEERWWMAENQLTAANKAIVALIDMAEKCRRFQVGDELDRIIDPALTTHAETIKRAKEST